MRKRIELTESDAAHVYEWLIGYWLDRQSDGTYKLQTEGVTDCPQCANIGMRLKRLIGRREANRIEALFKIGD